MNMRTRPRTTPQESSFLGFMDRDCAGCEGTQSALAYGVGRLSLRGRGGRLIIRGLAAILCINSGLGAGLADTVKPAPETNAPSPAQIQTTETNKPLSSIELESLVAPVAMYPGSLLGLVLTAARYPEEVQQAANYIKTKGSGPATETFVEQAKKWNPAMVALLRVPVVLIWMGNHPEWVERLDRAMRSQPGEVYAAIGKVQQQVGMATRSATISQQPQTATNAPAVQAVPGNQMPYAPVYEAPWLAPAYEPYVYYYGVPYYYYNYNYSHDRREWWEHHRRPEPPYRQPGEWWRGYRPVYHPRPPVRAVPGPRIQARSRGVFPQPGLLSGGILSRSAASGGTLGPGVAGGGTLGPGVVGGGTLGGGFTGRGTFR
ncbi:MAG: DUF3300 domain-containing protein [Candidatus Omnitrophica bacterium]|nr:DUF3300 domain-containing protein [Candidatus Omnitrophota bacterium]